MEKVQHPEKVTLYKFDGVTETVAYLGDVTNLIKIPLKWKHDKKTDEMLGKNLGGHLTLKEIREQTVCVGEPLITVFVHDPMETTVYQYGNYGNEWWHLGSFAGYA